MPFRRLRSPRLPSPPSAVCRLPSPARAAPLAVLEGLASSPSPRHLARCSPPTPTCLSGQVGVSTLPRRRPGAYDPLRGGSLSATGEGDEAFVPDEGSLRLLLDTVKDYAIFRLDRQGRVASWNEGARRIKGYERGEIIGRHLSVFYPPEDVVAQRPARGLAVAAETGRYEDEGWRVRKDGSRFWANVLLTAVRDERGELLGFANVTRDLSERRGTEQRFRGLLEAAPDAMIISDAGGRILVINGRAEQIFGYEPRELVGQSIDVLVPPRRREAHVLGREQFFRSPHVRPMGSGLEVDAIRKDGSEFPVE
ncbi:MAG: PAS domain-containing protein, partial [Myxococcales bacterium]|nr:PAS domain-containing protein [Myxococcales bacterium]